jgi:hypothetical protein
MASKNMMNRYQKPPAAALIALKYRAFEILRLAQPVLQNQQS